MKRVLIRIAVTWVWANYSILHTGKTFKLKFTWELFILNPVTQNVNQDDIQAMNSCRL